MWLIDKPQEVPMELVILDLEWNGSYSRRQKRYINEIIEFGAVKCDENLNRLDDFSLFVKPQISKKISSVIRDLTTITDDNLTHGVTFMRAVSQFRKWAGDSIIMTWGTSDILALIENCRYFNGAPDVSFLSHYCDIQAYAEYMLGHKGSEQLGLMKAAEMLGVSMDSEIRHRATDDSIISLRVLEKIYDRGKIPPFVQRCDAAFYNKITFKTTYISDLQHPKIKRSDLRFACPKCGEKCKKRTPWVLKNKGFRADFQCGHCGYVFSGRVTFKEKYEGVAVNKRMVPLTQIEKPRAPVPGSVGDMELVIAENGVGLLQFPRFQREEGLAHAFSTRIGGVSDMSYAAMNLGFARGDAQENVIKNYHLFAEALGIQAETMTAGAQDHQVNIRRIGAAERGAGIWKDKDMESVDGLCTDEGEVALVIYASDCVPLYFYDRTHRAIGLAHAGWKGTAAGMAMEMVQRMRMEFGTDPPELLVGIGPSIGKNCFEVDEPVKKVFETLPNSGFFVTDTQNGKYLVDLWECNRQFLLNAGVKPENIAVGAVCTMCNSDLLFSHRKTRGRRGSNAAVLMLRSEIPEFL